VGVLDPAVAHVALRRAGETVVFVGNTSSETVVVPVDLGGLLRAELTYAVRAYSSERFAWEDIGTTTGVLVAMPALVIEAGGFSILRVADAPT